MTELHLNPYADVDWDRIERHKAQLHAHTWHPPEGSHSGTDPPEVVVDDYRDAGYSVLALTDHEYNVDEPTWPWTDFDRDPDALGMVAVLAVELAVELVEEDRSVGDPEEAIEHSAGEDSRTDADEPTEPGEDETTDSDEPTEHDLLSLFCGLSDTTGMGFHGALDEIGDRGGLAVVPHPSRYDQDGAWYARYFRAHPHLLGVEVVNAADRYPTDRDLWDDLQGRLGAERPVWGFSNDDYHGRGLEYSFDRSRNVLLVDELTEAAVRDALTNGRFFYQHVVEADVRDGENPAGEPAHRPGGEAAGDAASGTGDYPAGDDEPPPNHPPIANQPPTIDAIRHDPERGELTVEARDSEAVQWASGGEVVAHGPTLHYHEVDGLGSFARARLVAGSGSETGTQPFLFRP